MLTFPNVLPTLAASFKQTKALAKVASISHTTAIANSQSQNDLPFPSWWSGVCDTNNYNAAIGIPATSLGKSYRGVSACGPRPGKNSKLDNLVRFTDSQGNPVGAGEYEWECVELSMRYMFLAYGIIPYYVPAPNGTNVVDYYQKNNTNSILAPVQNTNPSQTDTVPQPGDIISYYTNHTAVVTATNVIGGNGTITVMEQNASSTGKATINVGSNAGLPPWVLDVNVKNWLSHTVDVSPQLAPSGSGVNISGRGFGANEQVVIELGATFLGTVTTDGTGSFSTTVIIPTGMLSGTYPLTATGQSSGFSPQTVFYVQNIDWPLFGFNTQHTHDNPYENSLNSSNVANLVPYWSSTTSATIQGQSSSVEANGIVYIDDESGTLYAFNASSGSLIWSYATGVNTSGEEATPTVANNTVYYPAGKLYVLNAMTGSFIWSTSLLNDPITSATVVNTIVYVTGIFGSVAAFDATTHNLIWKVKQLQYIESPPVIVNNVLFISYKLAGVLAALDASNGTVLWSGIVAQGGTDGAPAIANGLVYTSAFSTTSPGDATLYAFKVSGCGQSSCSPVWTAAIGHGGNGLSSPAVANSIVYFGSTDGTLFAFNATTGKPIWTGITQAQPGNGFLYGSSPTIANGVVYDATADGYLYAFNASGCKNKVCSPLLKYSMGSVFTWSSSVVVNGIVYIAVFANTSPYIGIMDAFHLPGTTS